MTGLLMSYRFSSALGKWDEGKKVWVGVRGTIRDGVRMVRRTATILRHIADSSYLSAAVVTAAHPVADHLARI